MKEILQKSDTGPASGQASTSSPGRERRVIVDVDAVRAMAHPHRVAILQFLLSGPPRTATECAAEVGGTPSACSYHLRELARFGLVERVDVESTADDGGSSAKTDRRTRPWRAVAVGYSVGVDPSVDSPAARAAAVALMQAELTENHRLISRYLEAGDDVEQAWRSAAEFHTYELLVTPTELDELNARVDALLEDYRVPVRTDAEAGAAPVRVIYQAFPRLGAR